MMKSRKNLIRCILFAGITGLNAQNTNVFPNSGNVGIGTTTPWTTLHVNNPNLGTGTFLNISGTAPGVLFNVNPSQNTNFPAIGLSTDNGHYLNSAIAGQFNIRGGVSGDVVFGTSRADGSFPELMRLKTTGNLGIGTVNPTEKLDVNGNLRVQSNATVLAEIRAGGNIFGSDLISGGVNSWILHTPDDGRTNLYFAANTNGSWDWTKYIYFRNDGTGIFKNVGIGTDYPDQKLTVKGKIHAEEVIVDLQIPADYVFEKYYTGKSSLKADYSLPTLEEVEQFTKENKHLPNIPSAKEIQEKGLQLGEMTNLLLQKIEELTLYTIELKKEIEQLKKANKK